jgi:hypothetical protein
MSIFTRSPILPRRAHWAVTLAVALATASPFSVAQDDQTAAWTQQKFTFVVLGFQTRHTCFGLRTYIRNILLELGARREDLNVHEVACSQNNPPSVAASFWMLEPVPRAHTNAVPAHWDSVQVQFPSGTGPDLSGCELAHQAMARIMPYFTVRNAAFDPDCTQHAVNGAVYALRAEVLKPDTTSAAPGAESQSTGPK